MKELVERLIAKYDTLIIELETIDNENKTYLREATENKNIPAADVEERMRFARNNQRRLQFAKSELELLLQKS